GALSRADPQVRGSGIHARLHPPDRRKPGGVLPMGGAASDEQLIPEPETIYERTKEEGSRRLDRPFLEEATTAIAAGFDIAVGIIVMGLLIHFTERQYCREVAHVFGAMGFGIA